MSVGPRSHFEGQIDCFLSQHVYLFLKFLQHLSISFWVVVFGDKLKKQNCVPRRKHDGDMKKIIAVLICDRFIISRIARLIRPPVCPSMPYVCSVGPTAKLGLYVSKSLYNNVIYCQRLRRRTARDGRISCRHFAPKSFLLLPSSTSISFIIRGRQQQLMSSVWFCAWRLICWLISRHWVNLHGRLSSPTPDRCTDGWIDVDKRISLS